MGNVSRPHLTDPVVIYDQMLEARNRLLSTFNARTDDDVAVVQFALELDVQVDAVSIDDLDGQRALREKFATEREAMRA